MTMIMDKLEVENAFFVLYLKFQDNFSCSENFQMALGKKHRKKTHTVTKVPYYAFIYVYTLVIFSRLLQNSRNLTLAQHKFFSKHNMQQKV